MEKYLPLGTVVTLKNGKHKIIITGRFSLCEIRGKIGYFDYSAYLYPNGNINNQTFFFNEEDIDAIWFEGYVDEQEKKYREFTKKEVDKLSYPNFNLNDITNS